MKKYILVSILGISLVACTAKKAVAESTNNKNTTVEVLEAPIVPLTAELAAGKSVFEAKCNKCHDLPVPSHYTKERWVPIMKGMQKAAKISDEERELVYNYVTMNH